MQFVVTHLTRMQTGICTAGPETVTGAMIRPTARHGTLAGTLLARSGGPLSVGAVVDVGIGIPRPAAPHTEDMTSEPHGWALRNQMPEDWFRSHLSQRACASPNDAFGADLADLGAGKFALRPGEGDRSLAYVLLEQPPVLTFVDNGRLVLAFIAQGRHYRLAVTDIRLYKDDLKTPDATAVGRLQRLLAAGEAVVVGMGVGRAWAPQGQPELHWLQANNVYPLSKPYWDEYVPWGGYISAPARKPHAVSAFPSPSGAEGAKARRRAGGEIPSPSGRGSG